MKIIVNAVPLLTPRTGVGNYVYQTFRHMPSAEEFTYHYGLGWGRELRRQPSAVYDSTRRLVRKMGPSYTAYRAALDGIFWAKQKLTRFDLYHETNYIPLPFDGPTVVTVFDLSFHLHPQTHPPGRIAFMKRYFYPRLGRASHFITISEVIKREMTEHLRIEPERITVTHLGADDIFRPLPPEETAGVLESYGLKAKSYVLYTGTLEPRKNLATLTAAYADLPASLREKHPLVIAGGRGWLMNGFAQSLEGLGVADTTKLLGFVPTEHLPALYGGAAVFAFPSLYEGFGLPPLEAMACGAAVVASNASSLPEVVGDGGVLVPPKDRQRLKDAIEELLVDAGKREAVARRGVQRAARFSWADCARKTLDVYRSCLKAA
jgi:O-antigen biosynthesis alpha-1,3-rhamnosyltransferase